MASQVEISNGALAFLGDSPITSMDDNTNRAILCKTFYPFVRDYVLRSHPWRCAIVRYTCGLLTEMPIFGFNYKFQLPDNCLRVIGLEASSEDETIVWGVEGKELLSNSSNGNIVYVKRVDDPGEFDSMLTNTIMVRLAMFLASAITDKAVLIDGLKRLYDITIQEAKSVNAQEGSTQTIESNALTNVR